jgi:hypothetical protein
LRLPGVVAVGAASLLLAASVPAATGASDATTSADALLVNGTPVFPIMVFRECTWGVGGLLTLGINTFMGECNGDERGLVAAVRGRAHVVTDISRRVDGPGVIGWYQRDEADLWVRAAALPTPPHSRSSSRVTFLTVSSHFWSAAAPGPLPRGEYPAMLAKAEMIGFDIYPLSFWCRRTFAPVFQAQQAMVQLAAGKPTFQWIEAAAMGDSPCRGNRRFEPQPDIVHAEVWLAVAGGARGIGYFPGHFDEPIAREVKRTNIQLAALAPALLSPSAPVSSNPRDPVKVGARSYDNATWVIAVNSSVKTWKNKGFTLPGLKARDVEVWGENRRVPVRPGGRITDTFAPLEVHIYVCRNQP